MRVPSELRPEKTELSMREGQDVFFTSLNLVREQLREQVSRLAELDPQFFARRLEVFLAEWPERHKEVNLIFFWTFKFHIEAQVGYTST